MHHVYIIESVAARYYIGVANNVQKRLNQHNDGRVKSTKAYRPWMLRYSEQYPTLGEARSRENQLKHWKNRKAITRLITACSSSG
ncbi:MAG: GIY-YIG nuclease family protein [Candidatus Vogelbacteria bacterium]|nr:GIY-YIG nuclease family protein [Candidatus Vogelbacteria bacterium]